MSYSPDGNLQLGIRLVRYPEMVRYGRSVVSNQIQKQNNSFRQSDYSRLFNNNRERIK